MPSDMVRVRATVNHTCPITGMRRTVGEIYEIPSPRVRRRERYGFLEVLRDQATAPARKMVDRGPSRPVKER